MGVDFRKLSKMSQDLLCVAMSENKELESFIKSDKFVAEDMDIKVVVNGIDIDFIEYMKLIESEYDLKVRQDARGLIKNFEKLRDLENKLNEFYGEINDMNEKFKEYSEKILPWSEL